MVWPSPTNDSTCFLTDEEILDLYTFSFNISDTSMGFPPQCSNLSMSWPESLESNVTSQIPRRSDDSSFPAQRDEPPMPIDHVEGAIDTIFNTDLGPELHQFDSSSSKDTGNTTKPPTMFGLIPLGNSFSIPITYSPASSFAHNLPQSSISNNPTTFTSGGRTNLNWTVDMLKGTRFILVAGIGADMMWASGGSSALMTVGQGSSGCNGGEDINGTPEYHRVSGRGLMPFECQADILRSSDPLSTVNPDTVGTSNGSNTTLTRIVVACVVSIMGTLIIIGIIFVWRRAKRRRVARHLAMTQANSSSKPRKIESPTDDTPLSDIRTASPVSGNGHEYHDAAPRLLPILTSGRGPSDSPPEISPVESSRDPHDPLIRRGSPYSTPTRDPYSNYSDNPYSTFTHGTSSSRGVHSAYPSTSSSSMPMNRATSADALISPLTTRNPSNPMSQFDESSGDQEDVSELKRETLAYLGEAPSGSGSRSRTIYPADGGTAVSAPLPRRAHTNDMEYVVHRDAGRVAVPTPPPQRRVLELPPRYEELNWADGDTGEREVNTA